MVYYRCYKCTYIDEFFDVLQFDKKIAIAHFTRSQKWLKSNHLSKHKSHANFYNRWGHMLATIFREIKVNLFSTRSSVLFEAPLKAYLIACTLFWWKVALKLRTVNWMKIIPSTNVQRKKESIFIALQCNSVITNSFLRQIDHFTEIIINYNEPQ